MESTTDSLYTLVKPSLNESQIRDLCTRLYGIVPTSVVQLNGYDDQNFRIKGVSSVGNKHINQIWPDGYVLKIMNSKDSKNISLTEAQIQILLHLEKSKNTVRVPCPVCNINGGYYSIEKIKGQKETHSSHVVRLFTYERGVILKDVEVNESLSRELGISLFNLDESIKGIDDPAFRERDLLFLMIKTPELKHFLNVIKNKRREEMVEKCIESFEKEVIPNISKLEHGLIHGDFNEQNILIHENKVSAILDFGDCQYAPYIFELAIGICYILILTKNYNYVKHFLNGYTEKRKLNELEKSILMICVKARICQSLVLGLQAYAQNPENEYTLYSQKSGWEILEQLSLNEKNIFEDNC